MVPDHSEVISREENSVSKNKVIFIIGAFALLFAIVKWSGLVLMSPDAPLIYDQIQTVLEGDLKKSIDTGIRAHPITIIAMTVFMKVCGNFEFGATLCLVLFFAATVFPLYFFTRELFGEKTALVSAFAYAVHPSFIRQAVDIQTNTIFIFFVALWFLFQVRVLKYNRWTDSAWLGISTGLAFLTRPEGLLLGACTSIFATVHLIRGKTISIIPRYLVAGALCAVLMSPYVAFVSSVKGRFTLSSKTSYEVVEKAVDIVESPAPEPESTGADLPHGRGTTGYFLRKMGQAFYLPSVPVLLAGVGIAVSRHRFALLCMAIPFLFCMAVLIYYLYIHATTSHRYFLNFMVTLIPLVGIGFAWLANRSIAAYTLFALAIIAPSVDYMREQGGPYRNAALEVSRREDIKSLSSPIPQPAYLAGVKYVQPQEVTHANSDAVIVSTASEDVKFLLDKRLVLEKYYRIEFFCGPLQIWVKRR